MHKHHSWQASAEKNYRIISTELITGRPPELPKWDFVTAIKFSIMIEKTRVLTAYSTNFHPGGGGGAGTSCRVR